MLLHSKKEIEIGHGDIGFRINAKSELEVYDFIPPGTPGMLVPQDSSVISRIVIPLDMSNYQQARDTLIHLAEREDGADLTPYFKGGKIMFGEWSITFKDNKLNVASAKVFANAINTAIKDYMMYCAV